MATAIENNLTKLKRAYTTAMNKTPLDKDAALEARQNILDFVRDNVAGGELSEGALEKIMVELNKNPGKIGLKYSNLISLGKDASGKEIFLSSGGRTYDVETIKKIKRMEDKYNREKALVDDGAELITLDEMNEKYDASYAAEHEKESRQALSAKTKRSRLVSLALVGGALAVAAVSGGVAIPALVGVGGAIAGLGASAAGVVTTLGVTGVSVVTAAGAAGGWATHEALTAREPETLNLKYNIAHDKHVTNLTRLEDKLTRLRNAKYPSKFFIRRAEQALAKEMEKGLAIDQKFAAKFNKRWAKLEKGGVIADWLDDHGITDRFSKARELELTHFGSLRETANARVASRMLEAMRLNDKFNLNLQQGENFRQIMNGREKTGFFNKEFGRTVGEYDEIHTKIIEDVMTKNKDAYAKLGSWEEIKEKLIEDCGFDEKRGLPPRTETKMLIDILGSDGASDALKDEAKEQLFGEEGNSGILKEAIDEMIASGSYDESLAKFMKDNKELIVGKEPKKPAKSFKDAYGYARPEEPMEVTIPDPGEFTETAPVVPEPIDGPKGTRPEPIDGPKGTRPEKLEEAGKEPVFDPKAPKRADFAPGDEGQRQFDHLMGLWNLNRDGFMKEAREKFDEDHKAWVEKGKAYDARLKEIDAWDKQDKEYKDREKEIEAWDKKDKAFKEREQEIKDKKAELEAYKKRLEKHEISKKEYDAAVEDYKEKKAKFDAEAKAHPDWEERANEYDTAVAEYEDWKEKDDQYAEDMKNVEEIEPSRDKDEELSVEEMGRVAAEHEAAQKKKSKAGPAPTV